jgi:hypothetical protein
MARKVPTRASIKKNMITEKKPRAKRGSKPPKFYIQYVDQNGEEIDKGYSSRGGYENALDRFNEKQFKINDHGAYTPGGKRISDVSNGNVMKGPIDMAYSIIDEENKTGVIVQSNWNVPRQAYTSRLYGGLNNYYKIVEPDGIVSLEGHNIFKTKNNKRIMLDGREFDASGWPVIE